MEISKTQPMRSAEIALVDEVNEHDDTLIRHQQSINTLTADLATEISDRELADTALRNRIAAEEQARAQADAAEAQARAQADAAEAQARAQAVAAEAQARAQADADIEAIIGDGFTPENTIADSISATNQEVATNADAIEDLQAFDANIKIGKIADIVIPANDSISTSYVFGEPFPVDAACILLAQVITDELATLFTYTLIDCTYSGFSYSIANSDADPHTVALGFVAVNVNTI